MSNGNGQITDPTEKTYLYLKQQGIKNFPESQEEWLNQIKSNEETANKTFQYLSGQKIKNFPQDIETWKNQLGIKKKTVPSQDTGKPFGPGLQETESSEKLSEDATLGELLQTDVVPPPKEQQPETELMQMEPVVQESDITGRQFVQEPMPAKEGEQPKAPTEKRPLVTFGKTFWNVLSKQIPSSMAALDVALTDPETRIGAGRLGLGTSGFGEALKRAREKENIDLQEASQEVQQELKEQQNKRRAALLDWANQKTKEQQAVSEELVDRISEVQSPMDMLNWLSGAIAQGVTQIPLSVATLGYSSIGQEIGSIYLGTVNKIASEKDMTPSEVIREGKDESSAAFAYGTLAGILDRAGAGAVMKTIGKKELKKELQRRALTMLEAGQVEAVTEGTQTALEKIGESQGSGESFTEALKDVDPEEVAESMLTGYAAGTGLSYVSQQAQELKRKKEPKAPTPEEFVEDTQKILEEEVKQEEQTKEPVTEPPQEQTETPAEEVTEEVPRETVEEVSEQDIARFAERIQKGEKIETPEDIQFYENNKEKIEQELQQRQAPEKPEERTTEESPLPQTVDPEEIVSKPVEEKKGDKITFEFYDGVIHEGEITGVTEDGKYQIKGKNNLNYTVEPSMVFSGNTSVMPGVVNQGNINFVSDMLPKIKKTLKKEFTAKGLLPKNVFDKHIQKNAKVNAQLNKANNAITDLKRSVKKSKAGEEIIPMINDVLLGKRDINDLPKVVRKPTVNMRNHIDQLSKILIDEGVAQGDLAQIIDENLNVYMTRSYRIHDDPKGWVKFLNENPEGQQIRNKAIDFIKAERPELSAEETEGYINSLLYSEDAPLSILKGSKIGAKDLGIFKRKKDIVTPIRALLGEYKDPIVNYYRSIVKMSNLIANDKFLNEVKEDGMGVFLFEKPTGNFYAPIAAEGSRVMSPLNGLYTTEDIAKTFSEMEEVSSTTKLMELYFKLNAAVKFGKTVLSPMTHVRNFLANPFFLFMNGHLNFNNWTPAMKIAFNKIIKSDNKTLRDRYTKYLELGVVYDTANAGELRALLQDAFGEESPGGFYDSWINKMKRRIIKSSTDLYRAEDDVWKIIAFEGERTRYKKAFPEMSDQDLDQKAAEIVRATLPTYSLVPKVVKRFRHNILVGTFVSFPAEVMRNTYNTLDIAIEEIKNPATKSIGIKRLAGMASTTIATIGIPIFSRYMVGIDEDDDEKLNEFVAPWARFGSRIHTEAPKDGTYFYVDFSYSDPHEYIKKPFSALLRGEDVRESMIESIAIAAEPFIGEEILSSRLLDISRNKKKNSERKVFNEEDRLGEQAKDIYEHIAQAFEPGAVRSFRRIWYGIHGDQNNYGKQYDPVDEITALMLGVRQEELDVGRSFNFRASNAASRISEARRIYNDVKFKKNATEKEMQEAYDRSNDVIKEILDDLKKKYNYAKDLGVPVERLNILVEDELNQDNTDYILDYWEYEPFERTDKFVE